MVLSVSPSLVAAALARPWRLGQSSLSPSRRPSLFSHGHMVVEHLGPSTVAPFVVGARRPLLLLLWCPSGVSALTLAGSSSNHGTLEISSLFLREEAKLAHVALSPCLLALALSSQAWSSPKLRLPALSLTAALSSTCSSPPSPPLPMVAPLDPSLRGLPAPHGCRLPLRAAPPGSTASLLSCALEPSSSFNTGRGACPAPTPAAPQF